MTTTTHYLKQLTKDKSDFVDNLVTKGIDASKSETFTTLIPKILDIKTGGIELEELMRISDLVYMFSLAPLRHYSEKDYTPIEVAKTQRLLDILGGNING